MDLVFDVGNTETVVGLFAGETLRAQWRLGSFQHRTPDEYGLALRSFLHFEGFDARRVRCATIGSVVPALNGILTEACARFFRLEALSITPRTPLPIRLEVDEPMSVGADRIVNTLAASVLFHTDSIVVDLGTATTYDCVTAEGAFIGGVIAPGVRTAAERLTERTAKLPRVELLVPSTVIGKRTETNLQSGIFYNAVDAIDGMIDRIRAEWQRPAALVVATGGLAPMIAAHCRTVERIEPTLTLQGLRLAREYLDGRGRWAASAVAAAPAAADATHP